MPLPRLFWTSVLATALLRPCAHAQEAPRLADLDALTSRWLDLRGTLAEEQRQWRNRKAAWETEIQLLTEQAEVLGDEVDRSRDTISSVEEEKADVLARRDQAETALEKADAVLDRYSRQARRLWNALPDSLRSELAVHLRSFASNGDSDLPRAQRAQRLVAFLSAIEGLQNRFHATRESVETEQGRRQVDVFYLGLARGFAVSQSNDWAAVGVPTDSGWVWTPGEVDPLAVRRLINVYQRQETASLATVPLAVEVPK